MIEIRPPRPEEVQAQKDLWNAVFQEDPRCTDWFYAHFYRPEDMVLLLENGELATMMAVLPQTMSLPGGGTASAGYFFSLCTWPRFRGRGFSRHIILYVSQMLKDRGADCAIGVPREASLFQHYGTMGRLPTFYTRFAEVPAEDVTSLVPGDLAQPVDPAGYNAIRERLLEGLPSVSYPTEQIRYQEGLCRLLGGGLFRVSVGDAEGCALVERDGAERVLCNKCSGASISGIDLNRHSLAHILRATQEGIAYSFRYGIDIMKELGLRPNVIRAGKANLFLSPLFRQTLATVTGADIELYDTDGALGAARGAALGAGFYTSREETFASLEKLETVTPYEKDKEALEEGFERWKNLVGKLL